MYVCTYVDMQVFLYACMHACPYVCTYVCMHACMYVCMCIYIYMYAYTCRMCCMYGMCMCCRYLKHLYTVSMHACSLHVCMYARMYLVQLLLALHVYELYACMDVRTYVDIHMSWRNCACLRMHKYMPGCMCAQEAVCTLADAAGKMRLSNIHTWGRTPADTCAWTVYGAATDYRPSAASRK